MRICKLIKWRPALGVLAVGVFACGLGLEGASDENAGGKGAISKVRAKVEAGYQIRADQIPRAPAVNAYRSLTVLDREGKIPLLRGPTRDEPMGVIAAPRTGGPTGCEENAQCDDCNKCTADECINEVCVYTPMAECERCDDDIYCNGTERCGSEEYVTTGYPEGTEGVCLPPTEIDDPPPDQCFYDPEDYICDELAEEGAGDCVPACANDEDCDDEQWCTGVDVCVAQECVGGSNPGTACTFGGGECQGDGWCGGLCRIPAGPPCGVGVLCTEVGHICAPGRCCTDDPVGAPYYENCARETLPACTTANGKWLGVGREEDTCEDLAPSTEPNHGEDFDCPRYESGITSGTVIDVTDEAGVADCRPYREVGDDYTVDVTTDYFQITTFRWIGGHDEGTGSRMRITFYDAAGTFIEDTITETSYLDGVAFRTVIYDEMPVIPAQGIVTVSAAEEFSPDSRQRWAVTDTLNVGANDNTKIYADKGDGNGLIAYDAAGEGLAGGTLAFELVGQEHGPPTGACCNTVTGVCEQKVPWVCEQEDGFFQGIGTSCNVCSNFPMDVDCSSHAECLLCLEGGRTGEPCDGNPNACPDGACDYNDTGLCIGLCVAGTDNEGDPCKVDADCDATPEEGDCYVDGERYGESCDCPDSVCDAGDCLVVPPACQRTACCDPNSGACTETTGGFCSNSGTCTGGGGEPCGIDANCPVGETCTAATTCISDDDCNGETCEAPCPRGYISQGFGTECTKNNCCIQPIETGADTCDKAYMHFIPVPTPGDPPITITITGNNKAATFGDSYPDECEGGFNDGGPCDPDIDCTGGGRCGVDGFCLEGTNPGSPCDPNKQCCVDDDCSTDPDPGTCTAGATCDSGLFDPEGAYLDRGWWEAFSIDACADVRIDLCCTKEISGEVHQPQWDAIISDCDPCGGFIGTSIVGSHSVGIDTDSYARGYPFCVSDDLWRTFRSLEAGTYYHHVFTATGGHFGAYQLHITVGACPQAACCLPTATCIPGTENEDQPCERDSECDSAPELGDCKPDCELMNQTDCDYADGYWLGFGNIPGTSDPVATCGNNCDIGSCCTGPGACEDRSGTADCNPAQPETCMDRELCKVIGGSYVGGAMCDWPAPPCPACAIEGEFNCQLGDFQGTHQSDLTIAPFGVATADDFIPSSNQISSVCVWGMYMDANLPLATPPFGCDGVVEDNFRVRVYTDAGGFPGAVVPGGERWITGDDAVRGDIGSTYYDMPINAYTLFFEPAIELPEVGVTYWFEVANKTDILTGGTEPTPNTCHWEWLYQADGNDYCVMGTDDRPDDQGGGVGYFPSAASARSEDMAFCLGAPGMAPLNFTVADTALGSCCTCDAGCVPGQTLDDCDTDLIGTWYLEDGCSGELCQPQAGETCTPGGIVFGAVAGRGLDCSEDPGPSGGAIKVPREGGFYAFDTSCAPTDGPSVTKGVGNDIFVSDIWFEYVTNCTGRLVVSMCPTGNADGAYDSLLALYSDRSKTCSCPTTSTHQQGEARDETCNGILDAGAGFDDANIVRPGECWLIRAGGFFQNPGNDAGAGIVDIRCVPADCTPSNMPEPDTIVYPGDPPSVVENQKMRYLSFKVADADAGLEQAIRVTMENLPAPYDGWNGTKMYVGPPEMYCENSGKKKPTPTCPPAQPTSEFKAATLECSAEVRDWSAEGIVHVFHEGIIPGGVYHMQAIASDCSMDVEASWSDPLIVTMSNWGDLVRSCAPCPCSPPDGVVNMASDVTAVLDKFRNLGPPDVTCAPVTKARADHDWETPNQLIDISDATCCLDAFRGGPYPPPSFQLPGPPPCP